MPCTANEARQACPTAWRRFATQQRDSTPEGYKPSTDPVRRKSTHAFCEAYRVDRNCLPGKSRIKEMGDTLPGAHQGAVAKTGKAASVSGCWGRGLLGKDEGVATESASPGSARWRQRNPRR